MSGPLDPVPASPDSGHHGEGGALGEVEEGVPTGEREKRGEGREACAALRAGGGGRAVGFGEDVGRFYMDGGVILGRPI